MVWAIEQTATNESTGTAVGTGVTATFGSTPEEGSELVAYAIARPFNNATSTNVLSMSGWTKMRQEDTSSHSIAIFHKTAGASEPTAATLTATMSADSIMYAVLYTMEVSGGTFDTADIDEHSNTGSSVSSFSDSFTSDDADARFVAAIGTIRQHGSINDLVWDGTNRPANDPAGEELPLASDSPFIARVGWEEVTSTAPRTWEVVCTAPASAAMVIIGWPEASGGATPQLIASQGKLSVVGGVLSIVTSSGLSQVYP